MSDITTAYLNEQGYNENTPVSLIYISLKFGVVVEKPQPIKLKPAGVFVWGPDEFSHHGSRCRRENLFTEAKQQEEMDYKAPIQLPTKLYIYANEALIDAAIAYLKANYKRITQLKIAELNDMLASEQRALEFAES